MGRCWKPTFNIDWPVCEFQRKRSQPTFVIGWPLWDGKRWYSHAIIEVDQPLCAFQRWCREEGQMSVDIVCKPIEMWVVHTWQGQSDVHKPQSMRVNHSQRGLSDVYKPRPIVAVNKLCLPDDVSCHKPHRFLVSHIPRQILPIVTRHGCHHVDVHSPWLRCVRFGWCFLSLAKVRCPICNSDGRCCILLAGATLVMCTGKTM